MCVDGTPSYCTSVKWLALVSGPQFVWVRLRLYGRGPYLPQPPVLTCVCFLGKIHFYKDMFWQTRGFSLLFLSVVGSLFGKRSRSGWVCLFHIFLYVLWTTVRSNEVIHLLLSKLRHLLCSHQKEAVLKSCSSGNSVTNSSYIYSSAPCARITCYVRQEHCRLC